MEEWVPLDISVCFCLSVCIPLLHGSAHPVLPWQQGLVRHGKEYEGGKERKKGKEESTCKLLPAAETPGKSKRRDRSSSPTSFLTQTYLSFSIHTVLSPSLPLISILCLFILPFFSCFPPLSPSLQSLFFQPFLSLFSPNIHFSLCLSLPPLLLQPRYELVMTVVWSSVVKENCNYKNVSPGYTNRNERGAITICDICTLLYFETKEKSNFALLYSKGIYQSYV